MLLCPKPFRTCLGSLAALVSIACGSSNPSPATNVTGTPDAGDEAATGTVSCAADPRVDTYTAKLTKEGSAGLLAFQVSQSDPAPPAKGGNTFVLEIDDANGAPMTGDLQVSLDMPDHGHGTTVEPKITFDAVTNTYTVTPLYLFMAGVWRIQFDAYGSSTDLPMDSAVFYFCVEG